MNKHVKKCLAVVAIVGLLGYPYYSLDTHKVTVTDKVVKDKIYMIYTDGGTFTIEDSWAFMNFSSSDVYGKIKRGSSYTILATGVRIPFFSVYENIVSINN